MVHSSYLTYIKLSTAIKRNENMAKGLQKALLQPQPEDDGKRSPRPQDLIDPSKDSDSFPECPQANYLNLLKMGTIPIEKPALTRSRHSNYYSGS